MLALLAILAGVTCGAFVMVVARLCKLEDEMDDIQKGKRDRYE